MLPELATPTNPTELRNPSAAVRQPVIAFTSANLRVWGKKSALSLVDQGLTSAAGFGVNVFLARLVPAEAYGAFAVAFAGFLFISGFHNVLLLEPLSVFGPARYADRLTAYFKSQLIVHALLVGALSSIAVASAIVLWRIAPANPMVGAMFGGGLALPFLLLLWLVRRMCYAVHRPGIAVVGSAFYLAFIGAGLLLLWHIGQLGAFTAFLLMASGGLLAAAILAGQLGLWSRESSTEPPVTWRTALRENWSYGRWLVGGAVLFSVSSQVQMFLVAGALGLGAAGVLRAMQIPSLMMNQVVVATGLLILPTLSRDFGRGAISAMRHKALLASVALTGATLCFAALITLEAPRVGHLFYGAKYVADVRLMPILALIPVASGASTGFSMALRASQKPRFDLVSNLIAAPVAIISAVVFMRLWGVTGAAASMLLSFLVLCAIIIVFFRRDVARERAVAEPRQGMWP